MFVVIILGLVLKIKIPVTTLRPVRCAYLSQGVAGAPIKLDGYRLNSVSHVRSEERVHFRLKVCENRIFMRISGHKKGGVTVARIKFMTGELSIYNCHQM